MFFLPEVAFAPEPIFHGYLQTLKRHAIACFKNTIRSGQRIVEDRVVREVAHREIVYPSDRTHVAFAC